MEDKKQRIRELLTDALPSVNLDSDFLFSELDSIGVVTVTVILSNEYGIELDSSDITPKNFMNLDSIASMVENKLEGK
ncbi:MAG: acyl carrier protein [Bacteroidales bacterium]|nr:acyl carrier protein [Bacteroidales bacterium]